MILWWANSVRIDCFYWFGAFAVLAPLKNRGRKEGDRTAIQTVSANARLNYKEKHVFKSINNLLPMSESFESSENWSCPEEIVKNQPLLNWRWCSFLFMLAVASVTSANIFSNYPDCFEERDNLFFNCKTEPRKLFRSVHDVHILFLFSVKFRLVICLSKIIMCHFLFGNVVIKENLLHILIFHHTARKNCVPTLEIVTNICKKGKVQLKLNV